MGDATPVTLGGCVRETDDAASPSWTFYSSNSLFPDQTTSYDNPGPLPWSHTVDVFQGFNVDCPTYAFGDPSYSATVMVLPATEITSDMAAQELVAGDSEAPATASTFYFDMSQGMGWSLDDSGACADTGDMPAGITLDGTWSAAAEVPTVHLTGTPELGTMGTHRVCLALSDNFGNVGYAVLTVNVSAAPQLADTGVPGSGVAGAGIDATPGIIGGIAILAGVALIWWLRSRRTSVD
jgi:hypothetical protein